LIAFAVGALLPAMMSVTEKQLTQLLTVFALVLLMLMCCVVTPALCKRRVSSIYVSIGFLLGALLNMAQLIHVTDAQLPVAFEGDDFDITVVVSDLPKLRNYSNRVCAVFLAKVVAGDASVLRKVVRLSWCSPPADLKPGDQWYLTARLKRPRGTANPQGFDYQAWLLANGVRAVGYVRNQQPPVIQDTGDQLSFNAVRYRLMQSLFSTDRENNGLLKALLLGDKTDVKAEDWAVLQKTGTVHLMAISGLHIGLVAWICFAIGRAVSHTVGWLLRRNWLWPPPLLSLFGAAVYAGLAGFAIPTQRALIMVCLFSLALISGRKLNYWFVYFLAMSVVALADPFASLATGFWLSFAAVGILVFCLQWRIHGRPKWVVSLQAQWWLLVGLFLPLALLGMPSSLMAPFCNLIAVPLVSFVVIPLLLAAAAILVFSVDTAMALMDAADAVLGLVWRGLSIAATPDAFVSLKLLQFYTPELSVISVIAALPALFLVLSPRGLRLRLLGAALYFTIVLGRSDHEPLRMTVLDVQQGLGIALMAPDYVWLYDTGAAMGDNFDMGSRVIAPYLRRQGRKHIDAIIVSHGDSDHAGGLQSLNNQFSPSQIYAGEPDRLPDDIYGQPCYRGMQWQAGALNFKVIWPPKARYKDLDSNNKSCIVQANYYNSVILFTGDIDKHVEQVLLEEGVLPSSVAIVVAPHHGSGTSSSQAFIDHLRPQFVVFSAGYRNRYRLPSAAVVERWQRAGARVLRTDLGGAVEFIWDHKRQISVQQERYRSPKPWYF